MPGPKFTSLPQARWSRNGRTRICDIVDVADRGASRIGTEVTVGGWVKTRRAQKSMVFIQLNDGTTKSNLQLIAEPGTAAFDDLRREAATGACVRATGKIVKSGGRNQVIDFVVTEAKVMGGVDSTVYPLAKKAHKLETLRDMLHLRPRSFFFAAVTRVRNACAYATHQFFQSRGFNYIHTPLITSSDCEGAGEMFQVTTMLSDAKPVPRTKEGTIDFSKDFFSGPANLTVSGQLQVESFSISMGDVYTFGPTFRAEDSHTSRHLAEFWMIEPEIACVPQRGQPLVPVWAAVASPFLAVLCCAVWRQVCEPG